MSPLVSKSLRIVALTAAAILLSALALAQTTNPTPACKSLTTQPTLFPTTKPIPCRKDLHHPETSISLGAFAQLTATRIVDSPDSLTTASSSRSAGVLGTFRQSFSPWLGYSLNAGFTRASERGTDNALGSTYAVNNFTLPANVYELSLSYLAQKHLTPRLSPFAEVGAGFLAFLPENRNLPPTLLNFRGIYSPPVTFRPLGVGSIGVDYLLTHHLSLRAEYRGQVYKFADYGDALPKYVTLTSEPTLSLVYNFTHPH